MSFTFADFFCGIGGFHQALASLGGNCVVASDWDKFARQTYEANYGIVPEGDITKLDAAGLPDFDVLCAGFPCQPFSRAGKEMGFQDETQGNLFFELVRIIEAKQPLVLFLENVKGLLSHDKGDTWRVIESTLKDQGYSVHHKVVNGANYVPQRRERVFIVCFREDADFTFPNPPTARGFKFDEVLEDSVDDKYTVSDVAWAGMKAHRARHQSRSCGFSYNLRGETWTDVTMTILAHYAQGGREALIPQPGRNPRKLTPEELRRLFGFPEGFVIPVSDTQAYRQFGNSVVVPAVRHTAEAMLKAAKLI